MTEALVEPTSVTMAPRLQMRSDLLRHRLGSPDRYRNDHEIGTLDGFCRRQCVGRSEPKLLGALQGIDATRRDNYLAGQPELLDITCNRGADKPDTDERDTVEHGFRHQARPMNSVSASMTPILASGLPIVMRNELAKP